MNYYKSIWSDSNIDRLFAQMCGDMLSAPSVNTGHWQAKQNVPQTDSRELLNVVIELPMSASPGGWAAWMKPNLPWAEDHFLERVSGKPLNPPPSASYWPFAQKDNSDFKEQGKFSHSYPERLWPRRAPEGRESSHYGIRFQYGDLRNLVDLLVQEPYTRQAYIPLWFPEDIYAAAVEHERVPCTLGYHFILRNHHLHCFYPMRSLDVLRYARDDWYMAGRLCQWVIKQCQVNSNENSEWHDITPGILSVHAVSFHVFEGDVPIIKHMLDKRRPAEAAA